MGHGLRQLSVILCLDGSNLQSQNEHLSKSNFKICVVLSLQGPPFQIFALIFRSLNFLATASLAFSGS
jgi:hypothetical protein